MHFGSPKESFHNGVGSMKLISSLMPGAFLFLKVLYPLNISFFHLETSIQIKIMIIYILAVLRIYKRNEIHFCRNENTFCCILFNKIWPNVFFSVCNSLFTFLCYQLKMITNNYHIN